MLCWPVDQYGWCGAHPGSKMSRDPKGVHRCRRARQVDPRLLVSMPMPDGHQLPRWFDARLPDDSSLRFELLTHFLEGETGPYIERASIDGMLSVASLQRAAEIHRHNLTTCAVWTLAGSDQCALGSATGGRVTATGSPAVLVKPLGLRLRFCPRCSQRLGFLPKRQLHQPPDALRTAPGAA